jgi:hypothetical protein
MSNDHARADPSAGTNQLSESEDARDAVSRPSGWVVTVRLAIGTLALRGGMMATHFIDLADALVALLVLKADLRGRALAGIRLLLQPIFVRAAAWADLPGQGIFLRQHDHPSYQP